MEETELQTENEVEKEALKGIVSVLNIAEKKARIYSRLLTEVSLAKAMEELACKHEKQKEELQTLLYGKAKKSTKKQNGDSMDGGNE